MLTCKLEKRRRIKGVVHHLKLVSVHPVGTVNGVISALKASNRRVLQRQMDLDVYSLRKHEVLAKHGQLQKIFACRFERKRSGNASFHDIFDRVMNLLQVEKVFGAKCSGPAASMHTVCTCAHVRPRLKVLHVQ